MMIVKGGLSAAIASYKKKLYRLKGYLHPRWSRYHLKSGMVDNQPWKKSHQNTNQKKEKVPLLVTCNIV